MKLNLLNQKSEQTQNSPELNSDNQPVNSISPNLYDPNTSSALQTTAYKNKYVQLCRIAAFSILLLFFITLILAYTTGLSTQKAARELDIKILQARDLTETNSEAVIVNKAIEIHKKESPKKANVQKITQTLVEVGADDTLREFDFEESTNLLRFKIQRSNVLEVTSLLNALVEKENVKEIAILQAYLNPFDEIYTIEMEILFL